MARSGKIANLQTTAMQFPGKFITFEGGEGCGKTSQLLLTQTWLEQSGQLQTLSSIGIPKLVVTREPGGTSLGKQIRQLILTPTEEPLNPRAELLLYAADRAQHVEHIIKPALSEGALVLCDRYTDSTIAYQGYGRKLSVDLICQLNDIAAQGLKPDLTLWLDAAPEIGLARVQTRGEKDRIEQSDLSFHRSIRHGYQTLAEQHPERIKRIDASADPDTVFQSVKSTIESVFADWTRDRG